MGVNFFFSLIEYHNSQRCTGHDAGGLLIGQGRGQSAEDRAHRTHCMFDRLGLELEPIRKGTKRGE